VEIEVV